MVWPFAASYHSVVAAKRAERDTLLEAAPVYDSTIHEPFILASASQIVKNIKVGKWSASEVVEAYIARAVVSHRETNCVTEVLWKSARERAAELDEEFERTKTVCGPLHGVPISLKDQFEYKGYDASMGYTGWANKPCTSTAEIVSILESHGAIPIIKTNVQQTLMAFECVNPIFGRTTNPYSRAHTSGGSSGGEAAALAMDAAVFGLGSDVGGSVRIPAAYCGLFGMKPGVGRLPGVGCRKTTPGFEGLQTLVGPLSRTVDDLELCLRLTLGRSSVQADVPPLTWRQVDLSKKLKFGYYLDDGYARSSPACKRAVMESVDALRTAGHECIQIELPFKHEPITTFLALTSADGYKTLLKPLDGDPLEPAIKLTTLPPRLYEWALNVVTWIVRSVFGDSVLATVLTQSKFKTVEDYYKWNVVRDEMTPQFYKEVWDRYEIDGLVAPVQAVPVLPHGAVTDIATIANATIIYNLVDSPVGTVPVTRVDPALDALPADWLAEPAATSSLVEKLIYSGLGSSKPKVYDPVAMRGIPVSVQVIGRRWEEEKVVGMMRVLDNALGSRNFGPGAWDRWRTTQKAIGNI